MLFMTLRIDSLAISKNQITGNIFDITNIDKNMHYISAITKELSPSDAIEIQGSGKMISISNTRGSGVKWNSTQYIPIVALLET